MMRRVLVAVMLNLALLIAGCGGGSEPARPRVVTILQDDARLLHPPTREVAATLDELRALGVDWVRVNATWNAVERQRGRFDWAALDRLHRLVGARDLELAIDIAFFKPRWAAWGDYPAFAEAVARRYPDSVAFTVWNEPNLVTFMPQERAPAIYRAMVRDAVPRIERAAPDALVLIGATQPHDGSDPRRTGPLSFLRRLTCVEDGPGCRGYTPLPGDGWAHHPYTGELAPWESDPDRDSARMGDLERLIRELRELRSRFRHNLPLYLTEFGDQTNPPDPTWDITPDEQARRLAEGERIARSHPEVRSVAQFLIRDLGRKPGPNPWRDFQSGLRFEDGRAKPALAAFALPLTAHRTADGSVALWGLVRPGRGSRPVEVTADGRVVADLSTRADGTFSVTVDADPGATFVLHSGDRSGAPLYGARR